MKRRTFVKSTIASIAGAGLAWPGFAAAAAPAKKLRIGSCTLSLPEAREAGLDGAEVRSGNAADRLEIADPAVRAKYKAQMQETGLPISSVMMGLLNSYPLASDPRGPAWLEQTIEGAADLGAKVILVAFFSKGDLLDANRQLKKADVDVIVERVKKAAPKAQAAGITLALENYVSAPDNLEILKRIGNDSVKIYYDVYNLNGQGRDPAQEIRLLRDRIAMIHFKNGPDYLETGKVQYPPVVAAIKSIGYQGWIVLETSSPSKNRVADARKNAQYVRKLFSA